MTVSAYTYGGSDGSGKLHRITLFPREHGYLHAERPYYAVELGAGPAFIACIVEAFNPRYEPPSSIIDSVILEAG